MPVVKHRERSEFDLEVDADIDLNRIVRQLMERKAVLADRAPIEFHFELQCAGANAVVGGSQLSYREGKQKYRENS